MSLIMSNLHALDAWAIPKRCFIPPENPPRAFLRASQFPDPRFGVLFDKDLKSAAICVKERGLSVLSKAKKPAWIAGGAIRSIIANDGSTDLDCYFSDIGDVEETKNYILSKNCLKAKIIVDDLYLISFETSIGKIDLIKKTYSNSIECIKEFDFTVCCFAVDTNNYVAWHREALEHIKSRKLVINHITCPFSTMLRLQKYVKKGYCMDLENSNKLAWAIKENNWNNTLNKLAKRGSIDSSA